MSEYEEHVRGIFLLNLLEAGFCGEVVDRLRASGSWSEARVNVSSLQGTVGSTVRRQTRSASACLLPDEFAARFNESISSVVSPLIKRAWGVSRPRYSGSHVVRYAPGDHYAEHTDSGVASRLRLFSIVCYLNDEFEGGDTSFPRIGYSVRPVTGKAVVFPSNFVHRADPVLEGEKFVLVTWLVGPPPVRWI